MGRFSVKEYNKFRIMLINEAAAALAESGKFGALNLLFKRHPYTLISSMLEILAVVDPAFLMMCSHSIGETRFSII